MYNQIKSVTSLMTNEKIYFEINLKNVELLFKLLIKV